MRCNPGGIAAETGDTGLLERLTQVSQDFRRRSDIDWARFLSKLLLHFLQTVENCAKAWLRPESSMARDNWFCLFKMVNDKYSLKRV